MADGRITGADVGLWLVQGATTGIAGGRVSNSADTGTGAVADDDSQILLTIGSIVGVTSSFSGTGVELNEESNLSMTGESIGAGGGDARILTVLSQSGTSTAQTPREPNRQRQHLIGDGQPQRSSP